MLLQVQALCFVTLLAHASVLSRSDPPFQFVPTKATTPDNKFNIGTKIFQAQPPDTTDTIPDVYGARSVCHEFPVLIR